MATNVSAAIATTTGTACVALCVHGAIARQLLRSVNAELVMREELNNRFGIMHGGAIMALADNLGGTATSANLKDGQSTTTIESKTNFISGAKQRNPGAAQALIERVG